MSHTPSNLLTDAPLGFPSTIQFTNIDTQSSVQAGGGGKFRFAGEVTARIDGDSSGVFAISGLETLALRRDPELPPGTPPAWETVQTVDGSGPIRMGAAGALGVTVGFTAPANPSQSQFNATAVVVAQGTTSPVLLQIPIQATVNLAGKVWIVDVPTSALTDGFAAGQSAGLEFILESTVGHAVTGVLSLRPDSQTPFSSSSVSKTIPGRVDPNPQSVPVTLPVFCAPGAAAGRYDRMIFSFASDDPAGSALIPLSLVVLAGRVVQVTQNLPANLLLATGSSVVCKVVADDSGGLSVIALQAGSVPNGINVSIGQAFPISLPTVPGGRKVDEVDVTITVAGNANLGSAPQSLVLNWTVPADDSHAAINGSIVFSVRVLGFPLAPVDLFPGNGEFVFTNKPPLRFRDPGAGTPAAASQLAYSITQNGVLVDPSGTINGPLVTNGPAAPANLIWPAALPNGVVELTVMGKNDLATGAASSSAFTVQPATPGPNPGPNPGPTPNPPPGGSSLTLEVTLALPAFTQSITQVLWTITGPGAPAGGVNGPISGAASHVSIPLPHAAASYVVSGQVAFAYDGLTRDNGVSGPENSQTQSSPVTLPWSGASAVARFAVNYDAFQNVFLMPFEGLFGS